MLRGAQTDDIPSWAELAEELPAEREEVLERKKLWSLFDMNGNGYLSLAEASHGRRMAIAWMSTIM